MNWILVADREPELEQIVWCFDGKNIWAGCRSDLSEGDGTWGWCNCYNTFWWNGEKWDADPQYDDEYKPTHWMPFPTLPESQNAERNVG